MKITILTLFPKFFDDFLKTSITKKIIDKNILEVEVVNFRDFSKEKNYSVDDYQYGGGNGMVLMLQPIVDCLKHYRTADSYVVLLTPQGNTYKQTKAIEYAKKQHLILICGHYEGFDERILNYIDEELSIGDYILTNGEIPAMIITDSVSRLLDGAIQKGSLDVESFDNN
jgi:tRNA (guanine37-N1)-methyltransferase